MHDVPVDDLLRFSKELSIGASLVYYLASLSVQFCVPTALFHHTLAQRCKGIHVADPLHVQGM